MRKGSEVSTRIVTCRSAFLLRLEDLPIWCKIPHYNYLRHLVILSSGLFNLSRGGENKKDKGIIWEKGIDCIVFVYLTGENKG